MTMKWMQLPLSLFKILLGIQIGMPGKQQLIEYDFATVWRSFNQRIWAQNYNNQVKWRKHIPFAPIYFIIYFERNIFRISCLPPHWLCPWKEFLRSSHYGHTELMRSLCFIHFSLIFLLWTFLISITVPALVFESYSHWTFTR